MEGFQFLIGTCQSGNGRFYEARPKQNFGPPAHSPYGRPNFRLGPAKAATSASANRIRNRSDLQPTACMDVPISDWDLPKRQRALLRTASETEFRTSNPLPVWTSQFPIGTCQSGNGRFYEPHPKPIGPPARRPYGRPNFRLGPTKATNGGAAPPLPHRTVWHEKLRRQKSVKNLAAPRTPN